jgi:hypothetical protein
MGSTYDIGDTIRHTATYTDTGGNPIDPTTITVRRKTPDGAVSSFTTGIANPSTGVHTVDTVTTSSGLYEVVISSTGSVVQTGQAWFSVRPSRATT